MTHTITQSLYRTTTPTGLYEANYRRLIRLVPGIRAIAVNDSFCLHSSKIVINILEQYKYTSVISLKQALQMPAKNDGEFKETMFVHPGSIDMELRVCHDASLVEIIGYQGCSPIQSANVYPNKHMLQVDEKRQVNLFLKEVLEHSLKCENQLRQTSSC